ncbi:MAG: STM4011 family radical SAM protein [Acidobacteria bacterium]|nr:STM4011 family radical SAM protein [Acidobacteriota bacterium]
MKLSILYRGPLSSCNYGCEYCPFAKVRESTAEHQADERALNRFVTWMARRTSDQLSVLFTPWGEALTHKRYQSAFIQLSHLPHIEKVAIQTNLSCSLQWIKHCDVTRLGVWATFHPSEVSRARFVAKCWELEKHRVRFSVGVVGLKEHFEDIELLRKELPPSVYLWVNAYKRLENYYTAPEIQHLSAIDPFFPLNNQYHPSLGHTCRTGSSVISVDGDGTIRRCHFVAQLLGNLYSVDFERVLKERLCPNATCGCHIGYVHLDDLKLYGVFGEGVLERIPVSRAEKPSGLGLKKTGLIP